MEEKMETWTIFLTKAPFSVELFPNLEAYLEI